MPPYLQNKAFCKKCSVESGQLLLSGFFPVSRSYLEKHPEQKKITDEVILSSGLCQYCKLYQENISRTILKEELRYFVQDSKENSVVVALSGGKDSLTTLFLAVQMGLQPRCLMYQNGFIPENVIASTRKHCHDLGVHLDIVEINLNEEFSQEYTILEDRVRAKTGMDFCGLCSNKLNHIARQYMKTHNARWLLFGNKTYAALKPNVTAIKRHETDKSFFYFSLNFLYLLSVKWPQQQKILKSMNWVDPGLSGYTSNCMIPGFVANARQQKLGYHPEQSYVAMEKRSGSYTTKETNMLLKETIPENTSEAIKSYFQDKKWDLFKKEA